MDMLINAANILYVFAYFTTDLLRLRLLTVVAAACLIGYFGSRPEPLWTVVGWNVLFLLLKTLPSARILSGRAARRG